MNDVSLQQDKRSPIDIRVVLDGLSLDTCVDEIQCLLACLDLSLWGVCSQAALKLSSFM
jgi:hypothetical protein